MIFYFLIFLVIVLLYSLKLKPAYLTLICSGVLLFCIAAFRSTTVDKDSLGYMSYFKSILANNWLESRIEPSFVLLCKFIGLFTNNGKYLLIVYAFFGVTLNLLAIKKLTHFWMLSVLVYYCNFFLLHEMTQIRAGVAAGFFLLSIIPMVERKLPQFLLLASLAFFFHYSSIILFPLYFLNTQNINKYAYGLLIPLGYLLYYSGLNLFSFISLIPIGLIQLKYHSYLALSVLEGKVNIFNYVFLSRCLLAYLFLWKSELLSNVSNLAVVLIKIYIIGLFIFIAFARIPGISHRASEFLLIVEIILIPFLVATIKQKQIAASIVIGIGLVFLTFSLFYSKLLNPYFG